jgi:PHS family inorganic phosphate transporter-like MFS transporter
MLDEENPLTRGSEGDAVSSAQSVLAALDNSALSKFHLKAMITSGMGFFTDAYDLFIIGVVLAILTPLWHLNALEISLLSSTSLIAAALGAVIFGRLADHIGRHAIYGYTLVVLAVGAIASAFSPGIIWLLVFRFILGLGIGGDYPLSATLMSEYANRRDRGKLITMVFSMQGLGLICGPLVALILLALGLNHDLTWRLMLGLGAIPALSTFYLRRQIAETPRYALAMQGNLEGAARIVDQVTNNGQAATSKANRQPSAANNTNALQAAQEGKPAKSWLYLLVSPRFLRWLIGAAGAWFLLDFAYYGTTISSPLVLKSLNPHSNIVTNMLYTLIIFVVAALPGYIIAALTIDKLGRKWIQCVGFAMMALAYGLIALAPSLSTITLPFLLVYGVSYFFTEFGPNVTTFVYPAEVFPVMVRTTGHGISAASGKVGAFIGAFVFPFLLTAYHLPGAMAVAAVVSLVGLLLTFFLLPEPNQRSLEEISNEHALRSVHQEKVLARS